MSNLSMQSFLIQLGLNKIEEYVFCREIQEGKSSTTLIYESPNKKKVIVKMLIAPRHENELRFFKQEAEILKRLNASNAFVPQLIIDFSQFKDYPVYYFVIEYIEGCSLKKILTEKNRLEWPEALDLIQRIAIALSSSMFIIHRDLHPGNILIRDKFVFDYDDLVYSDPGVIILDYGCAKDLVKVMFSQWSEDRFRLMGAISSWSPELIFAPDSIDQRHDTWALGVMLFLMLTGNYPFPSKSLGALIEKYQNPQYDFLEILDGKTPYVVRSLLKRMLSVDPNKRFFVGEVIDIISDILYKNLLSYDNDFIKKYIKLHGQVGQCARCKTLIGRIHSRCPTCGLVLDIENVLPVLAILPKEKWLFRNI